MIRIEVEVIESEREMCRWDISKVFLVINCPTIFPNCEFVPKIEEVQIM
jgi:hypothetical protein